MSTRELKSLQMELCVSSRTRSGEQQLVVSKNIVEMAETEKLRTKLEAALEDKEKDISELRLLVEQAKAETENLRTKLEAALEDKKKEISEQQRQANDKLEEVEEHWRAHTEQQLDDSRLHGELESLRSSERLRSEHRQDMEAERTLMDKWKKDLKASHERDMAHLLDTISGLRSRVASGETTNTLCYCTYHPECNRIRG